MFLKFLSYQTHFNNRTDVQRSQSRAASRSELFECDHCSRFTPPVGKPTRFDNLWGQGKRMQRKHPEVRACFSCFSCSASPHNHVCRNMKLSRQERRKRHHGGSGRQQSVTWSACNDPAPEVVIDIDDQLSPRGECVVLVLYCCMRCIFDLHGA